MQVAVYSKTDMIGNPDFRLKQYCESLGAEQMIFIVDESFEPNPHIDEYFM